MQLEYKLISVSESTIKDRQEAERLDENIFGNDYNFMQKISTKKPNYWVFVYGKINNSFQLLGKANINILTNNYKTLKIKRAKISNFGVLPFATRHHVGSKLIHQVISECEKLQVHYVYLNCNNSGDSKNFNIVNFYLKNGFIPLENSNENKTFIYPTSKLKINNVKIDLNNSLKISNHINSKK